ncbi:hypothetical protein [Gallaecimonas xiamenensis]|uniref:Lipoprotein n=1 Tax=Gallaecimonas xiamenensis 3-C-1 TaxID=745411 RepID=K2J023_9GAMM|nr:hypothetical protein [Gallaecimonas xiamenensis]EKE76176.1 hypothetical protein B3C1_04690 [Gallaecimonas xiamenensis 3-C-1]
MTVPTTPRLLALVLASAVLAACGGSSGSDDISNPIPPTTELTLTGDSSAQTGDAVGIVATLPAGSYRSFQWTQTAGPTVPLLADKTTGVGFDAVEAGNYRFSFTATLTNGNTLSKDFSLDVSSDTAAKAQMRLDRSVSEGAEFSLRLNATGISSVSGWSFRQLSGPSASLQTSQSSPVLFVTAPKVSSDAVMVFEGSVETNVGTLKDRVYVAVQDRPEVTSPYFCAEDGESCATSTPRTRVYAYQGSSPYASRLADCVYSNQLDDSDLCTINNLPPIGLNNQEPTVNQIMDRVLVSHDWMGERFKTFLTSLDPNSDFKHLLRATTAIVIAHDIRPSFYWALTGAIYLDPDSLWLTPAERDMINEQPDFRAGFGSELQFLVPWRYVKDNDYAFSSTDPQARQSRTLAELEADLGSLLYHELTHANDFMSQTKLALGLNGNSIFVDAALASPVLSTQLSTTSPLLSAEMAELAQVSFFGETASAAQRAYQPGDVSGFFFPDRANDFYNYASTREDLAMLFEETMMKLRYGIDRDVAVTSLPSNPSSANDYIVDRGQRNRIAVSQVRSRALTAVQGVLPDAYSQAQAMLNTLTPLEFCAGKGWVDNLDPANCAGAAAFSVSAQSLAEAPRSAPLPSNQRRSVMPPLPKSQ